MQDEFISILDHLRPSLTIPCFIHSIPGPGTCCIFAVVFHGIAKDVHAALQLSRLDHFRPTALLQDLQSSLSFGGAAIKRFVFRSAIWRAGVDIW